MSTVIEKISMQNQLKEKQNAMVVYLRSRSVREQLCAWLSAQVKDFIHILSWLFSL